MDNAEGVLLIPSLSYPNRNYLRKALKWYTVSVQTCLRSSSIHDEHILLFLYDLLEGHLE